MGMLLPHLLYLSGRIRMNMTNSVNCVHFVSTYFPKRRALGGVGGWFPDIYLGVKHRQRDRCCYMPRHDARGVGEGGERTRCKHGRTETETETTSLTYTSWDTFTQNSLEIPSRFPILIFESWYIEELFQI